MDRRAFLRTVGTGTAATVLSTDALANSQPDFSSLPTTKLASTIGNREYITSTLTAWVPSGAQPWDGTTINHLYRRAGFGATLGEIVKAKTKQPGQVVDDLLNDTLLAPISAPQYSDQWLHKKPYQGLDYSLQLAQQSAYYNARMEIRRQWTQEMAKPDTMLREKMVLFWMNHFVVEAEGKVYYPQSMYSYIDYFRQNAWGNFKQMVKDVTTTPAMLIYLDGILNQATSLFVPNENYARELQELFTMGIYHKDGTLNYTQDDVEAIAHVLTGWTVNRSADEPNVLPADYNKNFHDSSFQKVYDGVNRQYNLAAANVAMDKDIIDHMFEKRADQISWYICTKLYQFFIYHDPKTQAENDVIQQLADTFKVNWSIKEVLSQLLKSEHFFDPANIGSQIKSPYDHLVGMIRQFDLSIDRLQAGSLFYYTYNQGQQLLDPPNVKGWPGHHSWMSTTTLPLRGVLATLLIVSPTGLPAFGGDGYNASQSNSPVTLSDAQILSWGKQFANYKGDFDDLLAEMAAYLCPQPIGVNAQAYIKSKLPPNTYEWQSLTDTEKITGLRLLANNIMKLAEYQLA